MQQLTMHSSLLQAILAYREVGVAPAFPLECARPWNVRCHTPILAWTQQMSQTGGGTAQSQARPHFERGKVSVAPHKVGPRIFPGHGGATPSSKGIILSYCPPCEGLLQFVE